MMRHIVKMIPSDSQSLFSCIKNNILSNFYQNTTFLLCEKKVNHSSMQTPQCSPLEANKVEYYTLLNEKIKALILNENLNNNHSLNYDPCMVEAKPFNPNTYNPYQATYLSKNIYHLYTQNAINEMRDFFVLALEEICHHLDLVLVNHTAKEEIIEVADNEVLFKSITNQDVEYSLGLEGNNQIRQLAYQNRYKKTLYLIENIATLSPLNQKLTQNLFNHLDLLIKNNNFITAVNAYYISNKDVPKYLFDNQKVYQTKDIHKFIKRKMYELDPNCQMLDKTNTLRLVINNNN